MNDEQLHITSARSGSQARKLGSLFGFYEEMMNRVARLVLFNKLLYYCNR